ncbi:BLUF domain-containing protein [Sphingomonas glacialis]|nr:BLUF domain-containing protein [Sphingomonas glacialis]
MIHSLLYVSTQAFTPADADATIARIVTGSRRRNVRFGVTGALIATARRFAQVIEGPSDSIATLFASIRFDPSHRDVTVLLADTISERRFGEWSLAYHGLAPYLEHVVAPMVASRTVTERDGHRLISVMRYLAAEPIWASTVHTTAES